MAIEFKVPDLAEGVDSADVAAIRVAEGDTIEADQAVMELETEKAVADLPCPHAGKITKIHVAEGDTVQVGQTVLTIEETEPSSDDSSSESTSDDAPNEEDDSQEPSADKDQKQQPAADESSEDADDAAEEAVDQDDRQTEQTDAAEEHDGESQDEGEGDENEGKGEDEGEDEQQDVDEEKGQSETPLPAGPASRRLARELHVDLEDVEGSGPRGRIRPEDVEDAAEESSTEIAPATDGPRELPDFSRFGPVEEQPLNKIARTAIGNLQYSWAVIPQVTQHDLADITELEQSRQDNRNRRSDAGPKITLTAFLLKAVAGMLREYPRFNSSLNEDLDALIIKHYYHFGVAVDTQRGLLVPVIRDVDRKSIVQLAEELKELSEAARAGKLKHDQMQGATFTISNQGSIGGTSFTPLVVAPQVAILGISRSRPELRMVDGQPHERLMLPLSLSYDHRVINGADAARFVNQLATELSSCYQLLIQS